MPPANSNRMIQINFRHIFRNLAWLPALLMVLTLASCGNGSDPEDPSVDTGPVQDYAVSIRISAGAQPSTRALPEEFGSIIENTIDLQKLKILVFDENRILKDIWFEDGTPADNITMTEIGLGDYVLSGKLDDTRYNTASRFSIAALVNWRPLQESEPLELEIGTTRYSDLADMAFILNPDETKESWCPTDDSLIPMYGVLYTALTGYSTSIYNEGNPMDLGTINVLRAVAKIEIVDVASNSDVQVKSITLTRRNCRGYLTPLLFDYQNTHQVVAPNIPGNGGSGIAMSPVVSDSPLLFRKRGNVYEAYVPEMALGSTLPSRTLIDVNIDCLGFEETRYIALAPYNNEGQPFFQDTGLSSEWKALLRNHIYRFTLASITAESDVKVIVDVVPYRGCILDPSFGLERD